MLRRLLSSVTRKDAAAALPSHVDLQPPETYLIGYGTWLFGRFAPPVASALGDKLAGIVSDEARRDHGEVQFPERSIPLFSIDELKSRADGRRITVVHFFEILDHYWGLAEIERLPNIRIEDFLASMHALDLTHTYMPLRAETDYVRLHPSEIEKIGRAFADDRSKQTLEARIETLSLLDRRALLQARFPGKLEYFNASQPGASLLLRPDEVYVDVGAANGDTVARFRKLTEDRFTAIHAFEPTAGQFLELAAHAGQDERIKTYQCAVGDQPGTLEFFDNPDNPFGSNALSSAGAKRVEVNCVRLDDVIDRCTLIKMDVEGFECNVLRGAQRLIRECRPNLAITCYHYPHDMQQILETVQSIYGYRHVALRHYSASLYDTVFLFSDHQAF